MVPCFSDVIAFLLGNLFKTFDSNFILYTCAENLCIAAFISVEACVRFSGADNSHVCFISSLGNGVVVHETSIFTIVNFTSRIY